MLCAPALYSPRSSVPLLASCPPDSADPIPRYCPPSPPSLSMADPQTAICAPLPPPLPPPSAQGPLSCLNHLKRFLSEPSYVAHSKQLASCAAPPPTPLYSNISSACPFQSESYLFPV